MGAETKVGIRYSGSIFWLIFWCIIFFPIGIILFFTSVLFTLDGKVYSMRYGGSRGWLCFWVIVFFPVALILAIVSGFSIVEARE